MIDFRPNERVYLVLRRHKITLAFQIFALAVFAVLIWVVLALLKNSFPITLERYQPLIWLGLSIYYLLLWLKLFLILVDYYLDVSIVTDQRLIDVNQIALFNREVAEFPLTRVQDILIRVAGPLATLLNFGDVVIKTASETEFFIFENVPEPYKVKDLILNLLHNKLSPPPYGKSSPNTF